MQEVYSNKKAAPHETAGLWGFECKIQFLLSQQDIELFVFFITFLIGNRSHFGINLLRDKR
jgi:hypothetical protein